MATTELKAFLEDRLRALDPTLDLEEGSPAQLRVITPILDRLGTDPFEIDISVFLQDRLAQEFPDIYSSSPGVLQDVLVKPLILLLEPFKRELAAIKNGQSLRVPELLSTDEAEALGANFYESRNRGSYAQGVVRLFFQNPITVQVEVTNKFSTTSGLNFFPSSPASITAEEMIFNRHGTLFYMDVPLKSEKPGTLYNVGVDQITRVLGVSSAVKVANPRAFTNGTEELGATAFLAKIKAALTERSLVTRRGATARLRSTFGAEALTFQVIGAGDPEMQRDLLIADSPGHAWLIGTVNLYGKIAYVQVAIREGHLSEAPIAGDTLFIYLNKYYTGGGQTVLWPSLADQERFVRLKVEEVLASSQTESAPFHSSYLVRWSGTLPGGVTLPQPAVLSGGVARKGTVHVSALPTGAANLTVPSQEVHMYGHADVYVQPATQTLAKAVIDSIADDPSNGFILQGRSLITNGESGTSALKNVVSDSSEDFTASGVLPGDTLVIEEGDDAGVFIIGKVLGTSLTLTTAPTKSRTVASYRVVKTLSVNLFSPRVLRLPFADSVNGDLRTTIGAKLFVLDDPTSDALAAGAQPGDTIKLLNGADAGEFLIEGFDPTLGGRGILVTQAATSSQANLSYEVFAKQDAVLRPLIDIKKISVLDSAKQATGVTVPYADPLATVVLGGLTSAQVRGSSQKKSGLVLPVLAEPDGSDSYVSGGSVAASGNGAKKTYSEGYEPIVSGDVYRAVTLSDSTQSEFLFPADAFKKLSFFLCTAEDTTAPVNLPPVDPMPGEALSVNSGPNKGSYLIKRVYKFKYLVDGRETWAYILQIYGEFPVDVLRPLLTFINTTAPVGVTFISGTAKPAFPSFFTSLYASLGEKLASAFIAKGAASPGSSVLQTLVETVAQADYEWGDPARGVLRTYLLNRTLLQMGTAESTDPVIFKHTTTGGDVLKFRTSPHRYQKYEVAPPRLTEDTDPLDYPRDLTPTRVDAASSQANFDIAKTKLFPVGVQDSDVLSVHEEVFFHGSQGAYYDPPAVAPNDRQTAVGSTEGSNQLVAYAGSGETVFTSDMVGNLIFIDEGDDLGGYKVVGVPSKNTLTLDKTLTRTTPTVLLSGVAARWGHQGNYDVVIQSGAGFLTSRDKDKYLTLYGVDTRYQGSYKILTVVDATTVRVERPANDFFPTYDANSAPTARWVITPTESVPIVVGHGTELVGLQPLRMYRDTPTDYPISQVVTDLALSRLIVAHTGAPVLKGGLKQPYRVYRKNVRRVTPTELGREAAFYTVDTEVVSLGPASTHNLVDGAQLQVVSGLALNGYHHDVADATLSYSGKEEGRLLLPTHILPPDSTDSWESLIPLYGAAVQVDYDYAQLVTSVQTLLSSAQDRVVAANMLAKAFLPAHVSYDANYSGGSTGSVIAKDLIEYISQLSLDAPVDISELQRLIEKRGGNPETPTKAFVLLQDATRKRILEMSENKVGGSESKITISGSSRVAYLIPGLDVSGQTDIEDGPRINLTRG